MSISDITGEVGGYKFKVLGTRVSDDSVGKVKRTILLVRLKKSYLTYSGTTKYWHPFYISSGSYGGTNHGDVSPFSGIILNNRSICNNHFTKIIKPIRNEIDDYERTQLKQITSNCLSYMAKCNPNQLINLCNNYLIDINGQLYPRSKINVNTLVLHFSNLYDMLNKNHITPAFKKNLRSELKQLMNNSIKFNHRFPHEIKYSSKICNNEFNEIKENLSNYFIGGGEGALLIKTLPEITDKEINSLIGNNNMFGINLSNVKKIAFDYSVWDKYKDRLIRENPTIDDINHYACMNDILLSILKKIGNISRENLHIDSPSLDDWDNLLNRKFPTKSNRKNNHMFSEDSPSAEKPGKSKSHKSSSNKSGKSKSHNSSNKTGKSKSHNSSSNKSGKSESHNSSSNKSGKSKSRNSSSNKSGKSKSRNSSSNKSGKSNLVINDPLGTGVSLRKFLFSNSNSEKFLSSIKSPTPLIKYTYKLLRGRNTKGKHRKTDRNTRRKRNKKKK